jgi:formylglycine-generating enzyme required for sulfatase activity
VTRGRQRPAPADVDAYPRGASPYGVLDLEGNVSEWTDEFADVHTRAAIIRGGASYRPAGSVWYFPQTDRLDQHQKLLLMDESRDRSGTIGFRCVAD